MNTEKILESKAFKVVLYVLVCVAVLAIVFRAGMQVGVRKADFSYRWGEQYHRNFGGPGGGFIQNGLRVPPPNSHGTFGKIISAEFPEFIVLSPEGVEKVVYVNEGVSIVKNLRDKGEVSDLKIDTHVVVIGEPNENAQIEAKLIRIVPAPKNSSSSVPFQGFPNR